MANKENMAKAQQIQQYLDDEFGLDIAAFQNSELERLSTELKRFGALGISTDDLIPAGDIEEEDEEEEEA